MKTSLVQKIRARDRRLKYPKSIITLELSRTDKGHLAIYFTHERFPDSGMVFTTFKTGFWVDTKAIKRLGPTDRIRIERPL